VLEALLRAAPSSQRLGQVEQGALRANAPAIALNPGIVYARIMLTDAMSRLGLPPEAVVEPAPGGATGTVWRVRTATASYTMRLASSSRLTDGRLAAIAAARDAGLPAPELIRRASTPDGEAVLLSWLPGGPMYGSLRRDPTRARRWGQLTGELQRRLHEIDAPDAVIDVRAEGLHPFDAGRSIVGLPEGRALLHLDWHPLNLLVDEREERIRGIVDWDNARRGHPLLDLARTHSLLTVQPSLADMPASLRARLGDFRDGWADGYGLATRTIPRACHLWAGRVMLADLEPRYADAPAALDQLRRWTAGWEAIHPPAPTV